MSLTMTLSTLKKRKIEEEEKYRHAVVASVSDRKAIQKHGVPLLLSVFIPGLGQLVKGHVKKGLLIFFAPSFAFIIILIQGNGGSGSQIFALMGQFWIAGTILYFWQLYDAYNN